MGKPTGIIFLYIHHTTMTTTPQSPQQAAMERLEGLLSKTTHLHNLANQLVTTALNDSVALAAQGKNAYWPTTVSDTGLVQLTHLKNELGELMNYYFNQKEQFTASLNAIAERTAVAQQAASVEEAPQVDTVESLRDRIERMASGQPPAEEVIPPAPPVVHKTNRQDRQEVMAEANRIIAGIESARASSSSEPSGLPVAMPVVELRPDDVSALRPQENSIQRLLGANSPLLDIFMMSPWLPEGRGYVTVGSPDFKWYKGTNPMEKDSAARATLPSGFYSGLDVPGFVVLRLSTIIIVWSFKLDPEYMSIYMVGPSDSNPEDIRWFKPSELAASHTRQLITELLEAVEKYKLGANQS